MRTSLLLTIFLCLTNILSGQIDTAAIISNARKAPFFIRRDVTKLSNYLTSPYRDETSKTLAISSWICHNIKYDYKAYVKRGVHGPSIKRILRKRKAVCEGYCRLFDEMCKIADIQSLTLAGHIHEFDHFDDDTIVRDEHAWSAVNINGEWQVSDLTWASGYLAQRKQYFRKLLYRFFGIPYIVKKKFKFQFNPDWIFTAPQEIILSHQPNLPFFQLLEEPVSIADFEDGELCVGEALEKNPTLRRNNSSLETYSDMDQPGQWEAEAIAGNINNTSNHRVTGFNYFLIADSLYRKYYNTKSRKLETDTLEMHRLLDIISNAEEAFRITKTENQKEFNIKANRNLCWKKRREEFDKQHIRRLKKRRSENKKLISLVRKQSENQKKMKLFCIGAVKKYRKQLILNIKKPTLDKPTNSEKSNELLFAVFQSEKACKRLICIKDSLMQKYTQTDVDAYHAKELEAFGFLKKSAADMKGTIILLRQTYPMIHLNDQFIVHPDFKKQQRDADSIYRTFTHKIYKDIDFQNKETVRIMVSFQKEIGSMLEKLQQSKSITCSDQKEDSIYKALTVWYATEIMRFNQQVNNRNLEFKEFNKTLRKELRILGKTAACVEADIAIEKGRFFSYRNYRRYMLQSENNRANYFMKTLRTYRSGTMKSLRYQRTKKGV